MRRLNTGFSHICIAVVFALFITALSCFSAAEALDKNNDQSSDKSVVCGTYKDCDMCLPPGNDLGGDTEISVRCIAANDFLRSLTGVCFACSYFAKTGVSETNICVVKNSGYGVVVGADTVMLC